MNELLAPGNYIDSGHPAVIAFSQFNSKGKSSLERAVSLYYAVRDGIRYDPFLDYSKEETFRASHCLVAGKGFCIGKAALLAACARADGIPARVGFADVKNHLTTPALRERMGSDLFVYHGYTELLLEGKWVKATPAFNVQLCRRFKVKPLEFDGREDSIFHPFDEDDRRHMEYLRDRGSHADVPVAEIMRAFREAYPALVQAGREAAGGQGGQAAKEQFG
jgi:transglutaminase-like putative cysteine protease